MRQTPPPPDQQPLPVQPVDRPILCSPYAEPTEHWVYPAEGDAIRVPGRRPASYWYKTQRTAGGQMALIAEEEREELPLVNALRSDIKRWRASGYEGATQVTKDLLRYWARADRPRRLFFCQLEAAETVIFLNEIRLAGRKPRFTPQFTDDHLDRLRDLPADPGLLPLTRLGLKMATGSGKTVVMAMLLAWSFCNRGQVSSSSSPDSAQDDSEGEEEQPRKGKVKTTTRTVYGQGRVFPEYFANREGFTPTIRIDSKLLAQAESGDPTVSRN